MTLKMTAHLHFKEFLLKYFPMKFMYSICKSLISLITTSCSTYDIQKYARIKSNVSLFAP